MLNLAEISQKLTEELGVKLASFTIAKEHDSITFTCVTKTKAMQKKWGFPEIAIEHLRDERGTFLVYHVTGDLLQEMNKPKPTGKVEFYDATGKKGAKK